MCPPFYLKRTKWKIDGWYARHPEKPKKAGNVDHSKGRPHFPEISARKIAYLLNLPPEFAVFFLVNGKRPLTSHDVHGLNLEGAHWTLFVSNG